MKETHSKILILGLYVIDEIIKKSDIKTSSISEKEVSFSLGGPPTYMGFVGNILSNLFSLITKPTLYTYVCPEVEQFLESKNDLFNLSGHFIHYTKCSKFRLDYSEKEQERKITLFDPLASFDVELFPLKRDGFTTIIISSVYQEFNNPDIFSFLRKNGFYVVLDPQGFFRKISSEGEVVYSKWFNQTILSHIDCLKLSENEAMLLNFGKTLTETVINLLDLNISYVIITKGEKGAILGCNNSLNSQHLLYSLPAYTVDTIIDETGAGDVFLYCFIAFLQLLEDKLEAIAFSTSIASLLVEYRFDIKKFTIENIVVRQETVRTQIRALDIEAQDNIEC
ncbi:MAG: PfkB family carbohydrate kinase [Candidatus Hodarchaeales archaeon]|jgi:hypothetical protein